MGHLRRPYAEFLPRFDIAIAVHINFVEAAYRSAEQNGRRYRLQRFDDLGAYKAACVANGLLED